MRYKNFLKRDRFDWTNQITKSPKLVVGILFGVAIISGASVLAYLGAFSKAAPGSLSVSINQKQGLPDPNPSYTSVFEVVFSESIDKSTFVSSDIVLGGTAAGQSVQSITEAGNFDSKTYEVRIAATSAGTIIPSLAQESVTAEDSGAHGTNQASTSSDNSITYNGEWTPEKFILRVKTDNPGETADNQFRIHANTSSYSYDYMVDCDNDGTPEHINQVGNTTCTYGSPGEYDVAISGTFPSYYGQVALDRRKALEVRQWGRIEWATTIGMFSAATNIQITAIDAPDLSNVTNMDIMFNSAASLNSNINHWDVSNVKNMNHTFGSANNFNQPLSDWDVSKLESAEGMFGHAYAFNQPLNNWDVSSLVNMQSMFTYAANFNQPINSWNTGNVTNMDNVFTSAHSFNQPINSWNTAKVTTMWGTFSNAGSFDQTLNDWDVRNVTRMNYMFSGIGLSTNNYDTTLTAWSQRPLKTGVNLDAGSSNYCDSAEERQLILDNFNWVITDGGELCTEAPTLGTFSVGAVTSTTAAITVNVSNDGGSQLTAVGVVPGWYTTISGTVVSNTSVVGSNVINIESLQCATNYTIGAFATNAIGTTYSSPTAISFTTAECSPELEVPMVYTSNAWTERIDTIRAFFTTYYSEQPLINSGIEYGLSTEYGLTKETQTPQFGYDLSVELDEVLVCGTWHYRAFATNANGTGYGEDRTFVIDCNPPTVDQVYGHLSASEEGGATYMFLNTWINRESTGGTEGMYYGPTELAFEYGPDTSYGTTTQKTTDFNWNGRWVQQNEIRGSDPNLQCGVTYHYRAYIDSELYGRINGDDQTFSFECDTDLELNITEMFGGLDFLKLASIEAPTSPSLLESIKQSVHPMRAGEGIQYNFEIKNVGSNNVSNRAVLMVLVPPEMQYVGSAFSLDNADYCTDHGEVGRLNDHDFPTEYYQEHFPGHNLVGCMYEGQSGQLNAGDSQTFNLGFVATNDFVSGSTKIAAFGGGADNSSIEDFYAAIYDNNQNFTELGLNNVDELTYEYPQAKPAFGAAVPKLTATPYTTSVGLDWDDISSANYYQVEYKQASSGTWQTYSTGDIPATASKVEITGLTANTSYNFRVRGVSGSGTFGNWSNVENKATENRQVYHIKTCRELQAIAVDPITSEFNEDINGHYVLDNDIDCTESANWQWTELIGEEVPPEFQEYIKGFIGIVDAPNAGSGMAGSFTGSFDGQGHTISNVHFSMANSVVGSIFWKTKNAVIRNVSVSQSKNSGLLTYIASGTRIENTSIDLNVQMPDLPDVDWRVSLGGLVGYGNNNTVIGSSATGKIGMTRETDVAFDELAVGGLVGTGVSLHPTFNGETKKTSLIEDSYSNVDIQVSLSNIRANQWLNIGGVLGSGGASIHNVYATGDINVSLAAVGPATRNTTPEINIGGLVGSHAFLPIYNSYSSSNIQVDTPAGSGGYPEWESGDILSRIGGLVGVNGTAGMTASDSFFTGTFNSANQELAPTFSQLVGRMWTDLDLMHPFMMPRRYYYNQAASSSTICNSQAVDGSTAQEMLEPEEFEELTDGEKNPYAWLWWSTDSEVIMPGSNAGCKPVNVNNANPNYFINNSTNEPVNKWNFDSVWRTNANIPPTFMSKPTVPRNLEVVARTTNSLTFNWVAPLDPGGKLSHYHVQYKPSNSSTWTNVVPQTANNRTYKIGNLPVASSYSLRVAAINPTGVSPYTNPVLGVTSSNPITPTNPSNPTNPTNPTTPTTPTNPTDPTNPTTPTTPNDPVPTNPDGSSDSTEEPDTILSPGDSPNGGSSVAEDLPLQKQPFVRGSLTGFLVELVAKVPSPIALYVPFSLLALLIALAGLYTYSVLLEQHKRRLLNQLLGRIRATTQSRKIYLQLTSHYINTPIAKMQGAVELLSIGVPGLSKSASKLPNSASMAVPSPTMTVPTSLIQDTKNRLKSLADHAQQLLESSQAVPDSQQAKITDLSNVKQSSILTRPIVWLPIALIATITILLNFLFIQADKYDARMINLGVQAGVGVVGILTIAVSYYFLKKLQTIRQIAADEVEIEQALARQQLDLIANTHEILAQDLLVLTQLGVGIAKFPKTEGYIIGRIELTGVVKKMEQLKNLARATNDGVNINPVDVNTVIRDVDSQLAELLSNNKVKLNIKQDTGLQVKVAKEALEHLIKSATKNAIEASPENSEVTLSVTRHSQGIQIQVTDNGRGIPADKLDNLFKPFSVVDSPEQFMDTGLGLDLYFSKVITEQYGGSITIQSQEGKGTLVTIILN